LACCISLQTSEPSRACPSFQPIFREGKDEGAAHVVFMPPARARTAFHQHRPVLDASLKIILGGPEADRPAMHRRHLHLGWLLAGIACAWQRRETDVGWDGMMLSAELMERAALSDVSGDTYGGQKSSTRLHDSSLAPIARSNRAPWSRSSWYGV